MSKSSWDIQPGLKQWVHISTHRIDHLSRCLFKSFKDISFIIESYVGNGILNLRTVLCNVPYCVETSLSTFTVWLKRCRCEHRRTVSSSEGHRAEVTEEMLIFVQMLMAILLSMLMLMYDMKVRTSPGAAHTHTHAPRHTHTHIQIHAQRQCDLTYPSDLVWQGGTS